jgi:hypothetical protein
MEGKERDRVIHLELLDDPAFFGQGGRLELQLEGFAQLQEELKTDAVRQTLGLTFEAYPRILAKKTSEEITTKEQFDIYVGDAEVVEFIIDRKQQSTTGSACGVIVG